jgi:mono/diheme cytochrome c family protein
MKRQCLPLPTCMSLSAPAHMAAKCGGDLGAGRAVCRESCKTCHGAAGRGNPAIMKASRGAPRDLSSKEVQGRTGERLAKDVAGGAGRKKPIKPLPEKQMKDVVPFEPTMAGK